MRIFLRTVYHNSSLDKAIDTKTSKAVALKHANMTGEFDGIPPTFLRELSLLRSIEVYTYLYPHFSILHSSRSIQTSLIFMMSLLVQRHQSLSYCIDLRSTSFFLSASFYHSNSMTIPYSDSSIFISIPLLRARLSV